MMLDAQLVLQIAACRRIETWRLHQPREIGKDRLNLLGADSFGSIQGDAAAGDAGVHGELEIILPLLAGTGRESRRHGGVPLSGFLQTSRDGQGQASEEHQPRTSRHDVPGEQLVGGHELFDALPHQHVDAAGLLQDVAGQNVILRLHGVAHGPHRFAVTHEGLRDSSMNGVEPRRVLLPSILDAVRPDQRMQPPSVRCIAGNPGQQPAQCGKHSEPAHRSGLLQYFVEKLRIHPFEQPDVEQKIPFVGRESLEQPRLHPVLDTDLQHAGDFRRRIHSPVAGNPDRDGPSGRIGHDRGQLPLRQVAIESLCCFRLREPQLLFPHDRGLGLVLQQDPTDVQAGGKPAARHAQVQVGRSPVQQELKRRHRCRIPRPIHLVERKHEGTVQLRYRARHMGDPDPGPAAGGIGIARRRRIGDAQPGGPAREGDIAVEKRGLIVLVQRNPRGPDAFFPESAAAFRKQGRLAESGGCVQRRDARAGHVGDHEPGTMDLVHDRVGDGDFPAQQPGVRPLSGHACARLQSPFDPLFGRAVSGHRRHPPWRATSTLRESPALSGRRPLFGRQP